MMTVEDTARVLAKCAAYDQRTIGDADVLAWHEVICHLERDACLAAVVDHYREHTHRIMPADVRKLATSRMSTVRSRMDRDARAAELEPGQRPNRTLTGLRAVVMEALKEAGPGLEPHQRAYVAELACREWLERTNNTPSSDFA